MLYMQSPKIPKISAWHAVVLVLAACLASFSSRGMQCFAMAAGWFLVSSGVLIAVMLPIVAPTHQR